MEFPGMETGFSRAESALQDLQKFASKENEISVLTTLNQIISTNQEEVEFLYNSNGIDVIVYFLKSDSKLANICLKLLANAAKRHEKVRRKLLANNIFYLLAEKLRSESDFFNKNLLFYSTLIVVLLQGNYEAQNQMGRSGCLSFVVHAFRCILDDTDNKPLPSKTTELLIYTIIASSKEPRHLKNQTEVGWIIPKILEYLDKQIISSDSSQLHIIKCFWFFLKTVLDKNESNQRIFLESLGLSVLFRSIQDVMEEEHCNEMVGLLVKMTGVLVKLKSNKQFLSQASNYCPVLILCNLLKTYNTLVIQQTVIFLDSLTKEFPQVLGIIRENEIVEGIRRARIVLLESRAEEYCQDLWSRLNIFYQTQSSECCFEQSTQFEFSLKREAEASRELMSDLNFSQTHFCIVHDPITNFQITSESVLNGTTERDENSKKINLSASSINLHRKRIRERERKLSNIIKKNCLPSPNNSGGPRFKISSIPGKIKKIFQNFISLFHGASNDDLMMEF